MKVDRAFVEGLGREPHASALVAAILAMADALGIYANAEGVETNAQLASLKKLGCTRMQGFIFARPMPADAMDKLVASSHRWPRSHGSEATRERATTQSVGLEWS